MQEGQLLTGYWYASAEAAMAASVTLDPRVLDIIAVQPGQTVTLTLTAFTLPGDLFKIGWLLDPYSGGTGSGVVGGNTAIWINQQNPDNCAGNVGDGFIIPTSSGTPLTATPSVTPYIPPYSGAAP
jgi:hypothetical protein